MNKVFILLTMMAMLGSCKNSGDTIAEITVETGEYDRYFTLLEFSLDQIEVPAGSNLQIRRFDGRKSRIIPSQMVDHPERKIVWQLDAHEPARSTIVFHLTTEKNRESKYKAAVQEIDDGIYSFSYGDAEIMHYNARTVFPPEGVDEKYKRSGFIHPLFSPDGFELTMIQPKDHIHHYGVWNPWTNTTLRDEIVDFWNLGKLQGTVMHAGVENIEKGPVFASLQVQHDHIAWPESTRQVTAMTEKQVMKVISATENLFIIDFSFELTPNEQITLEQYRYGGFVFRGTDQWNRDNTSFFTSEGLNRDQADGERALWCVVTGDTPQGRAGVLFMGHTNNFNHPEPLRVWPSDANRGNGDIFINFSPTRNTSWPLDTQQKYHLGYRLLVFNNEMNSATAQAHWNDFSNPPAISWELKE